LHTDDSGEQPEDVPKKPTKERDDTGGYVIKTDSPENQVQPIAQDDTKLKPIWIREGVEIIGYREKRESPSEFTFWEVAGTALAGAAFVLTLPALSAGAFVVALSLLLVQVTLSMARVATAYSKGVEAAEKIPSSVFGLMGAGLDETLGADDVFKGLGDLVPLGGSAKTTIKFLGNVVKGHLPNKLETYVSAAEVVTTTREVAKKAEELAKPLGRSLPAGTERYEPVPDALRVEIPRPPQRYTKPQPPSYMKRFQLGPQPRFLLSPGR
jgi:hypothetical protein